MKTNITKDLKLPKDKQSLSFIDLFCGIGGFHQAISQMTDNKAKILFGSEIDKQAILTYNENYKIKPDIDVRSINGDFLRDKNIDILFAGFPCQAFSVAGKRLGFEDETKGTLFFDVERILKIKIEQGKPIKYIQLENVANLVKHDHGRTYETIITHLKKLGYIINEDPIIVSPHEIGIPQLRKRTFILGIHKSYTTSNKLNYSLDMFKSDRINNCYDILDNNEKNEKYNISDYQKYLLKAWNEFYQGIDLEVVGFPITLPYFKMEATKEMPKYKQDYIRKNNELYIRNKEFIDNWINKYHPYETFKPTHLKFEWQAGSSINNVYEGLIQFRQSGIRVKKPTDFPTLVAMVQTPVIGKYQRFLTVREAARLQSFPEDFKLNEKDNQAYKQLGNSVNVDVVKILLNELVTKN